MKRSWFVLAGLVVVGGACSSSGKSASSGTGGEGPAASSSSSGSGGGSAASTAASSAASTAASSGSAGGSGGAGGSAPCPDPTNPLFGSCIPAFIAGCFAPVTSQATCTDMNGVVAWSDGYKYVTSGSMPGLYGPGDTAPCIPVVISGASITATKGSQTLKYAGDPNSQTATITCPDGTTLTATDDQVTAFNTCIGLNCP